MWNYNIEDLAAVAEPSGPLKGTLLFLHGRGEQGPRNELAPWEQELVDAGFRSMINALWGEADMLSAFIQRKQVAGVALPAALSWAWRWRR